MQNQYDFSSWYDKVKIYGKPFRYTEGFTITIKSGDVYFFKEGFFSLFFPELNMEIKCSEQHILFDTDFFRENSITLNPGVGSGGIFFTRSQWQNLVNTFHDECVNLSMKSMIYYLKNINAKKTKSAYRMIRASLIELSKSPLAMENTSVESFIKKETGLSRSRIFKILSDLKSGGYVSIQRGRLVELNKLPENY